MGVVCSSEELLKNETSGHAYSCRPGADIQQAFTVACTDVVAECAGRPGLDFGWHSAVLTENRLLRAAAEGDVDSIRMLLESNAFVDARRRPVMRPHGIEEQDDGYEVLDTQLEMVDDDLDFPSPNGGRNHSGLRGIGLTPLMFAAQEGRLRALSFLLEARASPHSQDEDGMAPLHFAAEIGDSDCCKALLAARARPEVKDDNGRDAFACLPAESLRSHKEQLWWKSFLTGSTATAASAGAGSDTKACDGDPARLDRIQAAQA